MPRPLPIATRPSPRRHPSAFTLIEILVTVAIIIILVGIAIAVGTQVKGSAAQRTTKVTLKTLEGIMKDYLTAGSPEPRPLATAAWDTRYGAKPSPDFAQTIDNSFTPNEPSSDPVNWVKALRADPAFAKKLSGLPQGSDTSVTPADTTILDSFGNPIRYIPYNTVTKKEGYFQSAGPDGVFANEDVAKVTPAPANAPPGDDLFSTDP